MYIVFYIYKLDIVSRSLKLVHLVGLKYYTYWLATPCFPFLSFWQLLLYSLLQWVWLYLIPHIRGFIHYISSFFWLISLGISSRLLHVVSYGRISFFLRKDNNSLCVCVVCVCVYIHTLQFIYHFICWWTLGLLSHQSYCKYCWNEVGSVNVFKILI